MLNWAVSFFVIAIVAAVLGFTNIAGSAIDIAKILFFVFLILAVVSFIFGRRVSVQFFKVSANGDSYHYYVIVSDSCRKTVTRYNIICSLLTIASIWDDRGY